MGPQDATCTGADLHVRLRPLCQPREQVYAVIDAARDREMILLARDQCGKPARWLFADRAAAHMSEVAPYLVPVAWEREYPYPGSSFLQAWAERLGRSVGILLLTGANPSALWRHLREVFEVADESGHEYFFRFYDPRVLRAYLPTCTAAELRTFLGPIRCILCEARSAGSMLVYQADARGLRTQGLTLRGAAPAGANVALG